MSAPIGFQGVAEHVHARAGRGVGRHGIGELRIHQSDLWVEGRAGQRLLQAPGVIRKNRYAGDLGTGARRRGNGNDGKSRFGQGCAVHIGISGKICGAHDRRSFRAVHDAAASEGDHEIAGVFADEADALLAFRDLGIGGDLRVIADDQAAALLGDLAHQPSSFEGGGGDEDASCFSKPADLFRQLCKLSFAEMDRDGLHIIPVHFVLLSSFYATMSSPYSNTETESFTLLNCGKKWGKLENP